ncbi:hypothetical protein OPV22_001436 [Ensete ventricosum]|uniref:Uncharacterized protein n=1 Tax=Ensete ventricosum TaxID=4639 RepID=A0AAV8RQ66_ENSVE|nr:hypothetical protein OPV22_001436 [Ensete ventricosum]
MAASFQAHKRRGSRTRSVAGVWSRPCSLLQLEKGAARGEVQAASAQPPPQGAFAALGTEPRNQQQQQELAARGVDGG